MYYISSQISLGIFVGAEALIAIGVPATVAHIVGITADIVHLAYEAKEVKEKLNSMGDKGEPKYKNGRWYRSDGRILPKGIESR